MIKKHLVFSACFAAQIALGIPPAFPEMRFEVRAAQSMFEPFDNNYPVKLYVRSMAPGYLTIYEIHPDSGFAILYPQPHHHWRKLEPKKEYGLADLAGDLVLAYRDVDGFVYIGMVMTAEPIHLVPWLEQAFGEYGIKAGLRPPQSFGEDFESVIEKVEADVRFRLGKPDISSFALLPILLKSHFQIFATDWQEAPRAMRYFYGGKYHFVVPDSPSGLPGALLPGSRLFPRRGATSNGKAILPSTNKEKPSPKSPRREKKN